MSNFKRSAFWRRLTLIIALMAPLAAWADSTQINLINLTGGITNFNGSGIKIGQVELGLPTNHVDLGANPIAGTIFPGGLNAASFSNFVNHATQVAGVMVSTSSATMGIAPGAQLYSVAVPTNGNDYADVNAAYYVATNFNNNSIANRLRVINLSYGIPSFTRAGVRTTNDTGNTVWEQGLDNLVQAQSVSIVVAAGNSGRNGKNSVGIPGGAYNIISVGSVTNSFPTGVSVFSSQGYLIDGRSKPDIVAPGGNVLMPGFVNGGPAMATTQRVNSGTSFAAPAVAAVVARLDQAAGTVLGTNYIGDDAQDPRTIKAVLLNSATELSGWTQVGTTTNGAGRITVIHPLDPNQGAGLVNAGRAYNQLVGGSQDVASLVGGRYGDGTTTNILVNGTLGSLGWDSRGAGFGLTNFYQESFQSTNSIRLTLAWNREVYNDAGTNYPVLRLADLNLLLWSSPDNAYTNLTLVAQSISTVDNVEQLSLTNMPSAYYEFGVYYASNTVGGVFGASDFTNTNVFQGAETYGVAWDFTTVPEPSALLLAGLGVTTLWWKLRRRRQT